MIIKRLKLLDTSRSWASKVYLLGSSISKSGTKASNNMFYLTLARENKTTSDRYSFARVSHSQMTRAVYLFTIVPCPLFYFLNSIQKVFYKFPLHIGRVRLLNRMSTNMATSNKSISEFLTLRSSDCEHYYNNNLLFMSIFSFCNKISFLQLTN